MKMFKALALLGATTLFVSTFACSDESGETSLADEPHGTVTSELGGPDVPIPPDPGVTMPFVHPMFANHMVLQRRANTPVWGWTTAGAKVTVAIAGKTYVATADQYGRWIARIGPFEAGGPHTLSITGPHAATFTDVVFGDVWLCGGQSNMEFNMQGAIFPGGVLNASAEIAAANFADIRLFHTSTSVLKAPRQTFEFAPKTMWTATTPTTVKDFSAVCYFFGRDLHNHLGVPIGLIDSTLGSTVAEAWTSASGLSTIEDFRGAVEAVPSNTNFTKNSVTGLYNGMIAPLMPYGIKGTIWYQGEGNEGRGAQYGRLLPTLIASWRAGFRMGNFPFIVAQLANFRAQQSAPIENGLWVLTRESQLMTALGDPTVGIAVNADLGEATEIHPKDKQDVGHRLAASAYHVAYGESNVFWGPTYAGMKVEGNKIRLSFLGVGHGLMVGTKSGLDPVEEVPNGQLKSFAIAGADKNFVNATATIDGTTILVSSPQVATPVAVRYAWADNPTGNLYNRDGLLASPFRTDRDYVAHVLNGVGGGTFNSGTVVTLRANAAPTGKQFDKWVGDVSTVANPASAQTTLTMPAKFVSISATYR